MSVLLFCLVSVVAANVEWISLLLDIEGVEYAGGAVAVVAALVVRRWRWRWSW